MKSRVLIFSALLFLAFNASSTTWFPKKMACPLCQDSSTYQVIGSYGSYIYHWPSKNQLIYWPLIESPSIYSCPHCAFTVYMWDFDTVPEQHVDKLKQILQPYAGVGATDNYQRVPVTDRLEIAEKVYTVLGRDKEFWCRFYRVMGYHYDAASEKENADDVRLKALELARELLSDTACAGEEKELYFIMASMYRFTGSPDSSMVYLEKAKKCTYSCRELEDDQNTNKDNYLSKLISDNIEIVGDELRKSRKKKRDRPKQVRDPVF